MAGIFDEAAVPQFWSCGMRILPGQSVLVCNKRLLKAQKTVNERKTARAGRNANAEWGRREENDVISMDIGQSTIAVI